MSDDWPAAGTLLATRYRLVVLLETGGMAQVWRATDELLGRPVAIKLAAGPQVAWREARMAAKLSHPNIAAVHDYREAVRDDGSVAPFVVMELLAGETVAARLERETFSWPEAARVGAAVADALAAAHDSGVVHRDIKPGNVMLTPTGVKILDFGISATAGEPDDDDTGATFGTPAYVAPERLDGMPAEPATDVYGLGVLLFEMVTGDPPYPVNTWEELDEARLTGPTTLPDSLPADFRAVVNHCMEESPTDRPGADEIRFTLTALWLADQPADEKPSTQPAPAPPEGAPQPGPDGSPPGQSGPQPRQSSPQPGQGGPHGSQHAPGRPSRGQGTSQPGPGNPHPGPGRPQSAPGTTIPAPARPELEPVAAGAQPGMHPRVAQLWSGEPRPNTRPGYVAGRAAPATVPMSEKEHSVEAPPRRVGMIVGVLALLLAAIGAYTLINRPKTKTDANPPAQQINPATPRYSPGPTTAATTTAPTTPPVVPKTSIVPKLSFDDAVSRLRTSVEDGAATGDIRGDVATDLLNLIANLERAGSKDVDARIEEIRLKITQRAREGASSLTAARATILRARLTDVDRAAGA